MIGRLQKTVINCPEPRALADFYCEILGMRVYESIYGWPRTRRGGWSSDAMAGRNLLSNERSHGHHPSSPTLGTLSAPTWTSL
jgi:catechol 2,3-dioxygenase-like lactoylglutathione lyase family enzyme